MVGRLRDQVHGLSLFAIGLGFVGCGDSSEGGYTAAPPSEARSLHGTFPFTFDGPKLARSGPRSCAECHAEEVADWEKSHHAKANRPVSKALDAAAFTPAREIKESGVTYRMEMQDEKFWLQVIDAEGKSTPYELVGVIGYTPIRQYLTRFEGNKYQTISASYDVLEDEWVDVFAEQDRVPGEWGHWTGQGMNWNANCAYCHTTEYHKGYDFEADHYASTWIQQGIACAECHTGLEEHLQLARSGGDTTLPPLDREQIEANCASCHSRRDQLTADAFEPGDAYHDHFGLSLPDQPGLYYPDGQIRDEVFVHTSFQMSRMNHSGVSCMDCHNPHSMELTLPVQNNMLCMRCHDTGHMEAPVIEPVAHSFHQEGSTGNQCVSCHMPKTTYMQVDPRADHGFHSPDPLMTKELGIPNACSSCHTEESVDWAVEHAENWYGEKLAKSRQRQRARALHAAYNYDPAALEKLIALLENEEIAVWRATYAGLIRGYFPNETAVAAIRPLLNDEDALVRERAVSAMLLHDPENPKKMDALADSSRSVRIAAARALENANHPIPDKSTAGEWNAYLQFNADRPQTLFVLANRAARQENLPDLRKYIDRAIQLDRANAQMYHQSAILLSTVGLMKEARTRLFEGWELAPEDPIFPYSLGLLAAETGEMNTAVGYLEEAVALEPNFSRAWYNLSLAYQRTNQPEAAARAMRRARGQQ
jgi:tetratricopeptide (TPR) repeat protein/nitrate/TMAO reductase-like tetraheme cytochrome c subunit